VVAVAAAVVARLHHSQKRRLAPREQPGGVPGSMNQLETAARERRSPT
jgi:hypothetical protein